MKGDFTRDTFHPEKHFSRVLLQQGRVGLDADWNEQAEITTYRTETEALDVIGRAGAPMHDAGFAISIGTGGNFGIGAGRFYVDGILCKNEEQVSFDKQPYLPGTAVLTAGRYIVYLDVWERHLTALDDPDIREVALGGPDTATRGQTVWQVRTVPVAAQIGCPDASPEWDTAIAPSDGQLSARAQPDAQSDKPCIVPPGAGYRRLENQLYRVEIHRAGASWDQSLMGSNVKLASPATFKWSRDNGSIAARIASITGYTITLTTSRRDSALGFAPGQWIEVIDAGQELRGEPGPLVRITAVDDLMLTLDSSTVIGTWPSLLDMALLPKVRRWDSIGSLAATIPSTNDGFIPLEDGVEVKFEQGSHHTGDHWMFPARTDKGDVEWPQDSGTIPKPLPQPARGIIHHFCRLAIIDVANSGAVTVIEDCRRLFPPLTELEDACGCCTKTVGQTGEADYRLIQEAVDSLPSTGGQICVLAGNYAESVEITGKQNITIVGCDERSVLAAGPSKAQVIGPIIQIKDSSNVRLKNLLFVEQEHSAIQVLGSNYVAITECKILMVQPNSPQPAIFFQADDGLIERNLISIFELTSFPHSMFRMAAAAMPPAAAGSSQLAGSGHPASGIQLAGGCHRVRVVENVITNVKGQGITFGHLEVVPLSASSPATGTMPDAAAAKMVVGRWTDPDDKCVDCKAITNQAPIHSSKMAAQQTHEIISPLSLWDIHIERNRIEGAGLDGIGVIGFFDLGAVDEFVRVRGLTILGNEIADCLSLARAPIAADWVDWMGYGGIALADVSELVVHDNVIKGNGAQLDQPVCGIFVLHGDGIDIERNRILANGYQPQKLLQTPQTIPQPGRSGGIQIVYALAPVAVGASVGTPDSAGIIDWSVPVSEPTGFPAFKLHHNIVSAPVGPALSVVALGPVSVVGNQLTSGRVEPGRSRVFAPATVFIFNLGVSNEIYTQQNSLANMRAQPPAPVRGLDDRDVGRLSNGNILFTDNQCSLDLLEPGDKFLLTSLVLASLDDIGFLNNQCDCNLRSDDPPIITQAYLLSPSLRVIGNRFKESVFNAAYSAIVTGILNITAHNEATHCIQVNGLNQYMQDGPNIIFANSQCQPGIEDTWDRLIVLRNQI